MTETTWFWIGTIGMTLGAVLVFLVAKARTQDEEGHKIVHVVVIVIAACSYLAMAFGQGALQIGERLFWYARYLDWSVTTPLLLLGLSMTALHGAHRRPALVAALLGADALMIITGLFSGLSEDPTHRFAWFLVSTGAFLAILAGLLGPLRVESRLRDHGRRAGFARNAALLGLLWGIYPVVVALGPDGAGVVTATTTTGLITVLDLVAKVVYGLLSSLATGRITDSDLSRDEVTGVAVSDHPVPSVGQRS